MLTANVAISFIIYSKDFKMQEGGKRACGNRA